MLVGSLKVNYGFFSMGGSDLCQEIVIRADAGFVYSETVIRLRFIFVYCMFLFFNQLLKCKCVLAITWNRSWKPSNIAMTQTSFTETSKCEWSYLSIFAIFVPTLLRGEELYTQLGFFFVPWIFASRYIHRRELRLVSLESSSSVEYGIKKIF